MELVLWCSLGYEFWNILATYCKDGRICLDAFLVREQLKYLTLFALLQVTVFIHDITHASVGKSQKETDS